MTVLRPVLVLFCFLAFFTCGAASARVFDVGPTEKYTTISELSTRVEPGDIIRVTGDIEDKAILTRHGTSDKPIIIRGVTGNKNGVILRPRVSPASPAKNPAYALVCAGDNYLIEGLEFSASHVPSNTRISAIEVRGGNTTIKNCCFRHFNGRAVQSAAGAGNITIEFCEFDSNGSTGSEIEHRQTLDLFSDVPGACATVQHCFFHNGTGGNFLKSRYCRNVIRYNWFESPFLNCLHIIDSITAVDADAKALLYPMHTDIVGNVFFEGWSPRIPWSAMRIGGEDSTAAGTEGDFNISHNLFVVTCAGLDPPVAIAVLGNVDKIRLYNNVFVDYGVPLFKVHWRGKTWDTARTQQFIARRGNGDPIIEGAGNWISDKVALLPDALAGSIRGINPLFKDLIHCDFRPRADSPLSGAGLFPLPRGQIVDLLPEYEPVRGIPPDLKPRTRRKAAPPAIGPFEIEN